MERSRRRPKDADSDAAPAGHASFAHMAGALQAEPRAPAPAPGPPPPPPRPAPADAAAALKEAESMILAGNGEGAIALLQACWPMIESAPDAVTTGIGWHLRAVAHEHAGRLKDGMLAGYRAISVFEQAAAPARLVRVLSIQALIFAQLGDAPGALDLLGRAVAVLPKLAGNARDTCIFWVNAAGSYAVLGDLDRAVHAGEMSAEFAQALEPSDGMRSLAEGHLLGYRMEREEKREPGSPEHLAAIAKVREHMAADLAAGRMDVVPFRAEACAGSLLKCDCLDEAREVLRTGVDAVVASGNHLKRGALEMRLAEVERRGGHYKTAGAHIAQALELLAQHEDQRGLEEAHLENSRLQEAQGRWRSALDSFKQHAAVRDALQKARADTRAQALMTRLEVERSRVEAELLRLRNAQLQQSVTKLVDEAGELKRQALEDPLTGLANRRMFDVRVAELRQAHPALPLLLCDIDHFKRVNDGHSHATGDLVLQRIGVLLREYSRPHDVVARHGGEEFVIAFGGGLDAATALRVAERLRKGVEAHDWSTVVPGLKVTLSAGLSWCEAGEGVERALERADQALYAAKAAGRNRIHVS